MSNTGHKGISASFDRDGAPWRYQVSVQWKSRMRRANLIGATFEEAVEMRTRFERQLTKPRSERHIRGGVNRGTYSSTDGGGKPSWVAQVGASKRSFSIKKYGKQARVLAQETRMEMLRKADPELHDWIEAR